jgi:hypothetical protein
MNAAVLLAPLLFLMLPLVMARVESRLGGAQPVVDTRGDRGRQAAGERGVTG